MQKMKRWFSDFAKWTAKASGKPLTFGLAVVVLLVWALSGPAFHYSDTWQLVINTGTTIVTFLMVFLIQNTQNRDSIATQVKLDELIRSIKEARNSLLDLEELEEEDLEYIRDEYEKLSAAGRKEMREQMSKLPQTKTEEKSSQQKKKES